MVSQNPLITLFKEQLENESTGIAGDLNLQKRGDYLIWWYFLKLHSMKPDEIAEIVCDGGNDLGIDAIYIDENNLINFYQFKNPQDCQSTFPEGDVDKIISGLTLILNRDHESIANPELLSRIEEIYQSIPTGYVLHIVTSGCGISNEAETKLTSFIEHLQGPSETFFTYFVEDISNLQDRFYQKSLPSIDDPIAFSINKQAPYQVRSADHDSYMFHLCGTELSALYECFHEQLLQQNIRVFRGERGTNTNILNSAIGNESANFIHYNNGVTFLCESAVWDQFLSRLTIHKAQIVNGGQTIRILHKARTDGNLRDDVLVPVRVIVSKGDKEFGSNVTVNLNNQNRIVSSFLRSNDPRVVQLGNSLASRGWYLERRENEVKQLSEEERGQIEQRIGHHPLSDRVIRLKDASQAYVATYYRQPEIAKKNTGKIFLGSQDGGYFERIFNIDLTAEKLLLSQQLKWHVDEYIKQFMTLKRRKDRVSDWKADYKTLLGNELVDKHHDVLDQVIPQSGIFLCAIVFEEHVVLKNGDPQTVIDEISTNGFSVVNEAIQLIIQFAKHNPSIANRSWPTLLKSQAFFQNFATYLQGRYSSSTS